ncbi:hypothetical protein BC834DRAFT_919305 [Gloeopeniophorella convolvens]|nr:hypothetical protein BC834DRAFT_919305 [Gloeopeniophorella convolvens]
MNPPQSMPASNGPGSEVVINASAQSLIGILSSDFPSLTSVPTLLRAMDANRSFKQGSPSESFTALLERIQHADPMSPDISEENMEENWGHDQFTGGDLTLTSTLTSWKEIGNVTAAFELIAASIKTCKDARLMCERVGKPTTTSGFISDVYLEKVLEKIEACWAGAGGGIISPTRLPPIPATPPSYRDVAMASPIHGTISPIRLPRAPTPPASIALGSTISTPGTNSSQKQMPNVPPSASESEGRASNNVPADAAKLKLLQIAELQAWMNEHNIEAPKSKRKDDIIVALVSASESTRLSNLDVDDIVGKRKHKKASSKRQSAAA